MSLNWFKSIAVFNLFWKKNFLAPLVEALEKYIRNKFLFNLTTR